MIPEAIDRDQNPNKEKDEKLLAELIKNSGQDILSRFGIDETKQKLICPVICVLSLLVVLQKLKMSSYNDTLSLSFF